MTNEKLTVAIPDRDLARTLAGALQDLLEPTPDALTLFEIPGEGWRIDAYYDAPADLAVLNARLGEIVGLNCPTIAREAIPDENWVALSQAALPPVHAGRFTVHGSHDRGRVARGPNSILVDAGEAFGTAHHATTYGCLEAIDSITRRRPYCHVLDLGCGTGVLAIAATRALPHARVIATDLDRQSVLVARTNMTANGAGRRITALCAAGLDHATLRTAPDFDLVIANILAGPLIKLSRDIATTMSTGGTLVMSGILTPQAPAVISTYCSHGFALEHQRRIAGWSTLLMTKRL